MTIKFTRRAALLAAGTAAVALATTRDAAASAATTTLRNGGFEDPVVAGVIPGWGVAYGNASLVSVVTSHAHGGGHALRLDDSSSTTAVGAISDAVSLVGEGDVRVEVWSMVTAEAPAALVYLQYYDASGAQVGQVIQQTGTTPNTWLLTSFVSTPPSGATSLRILLYSPSSRTSEVFWDDVAVIRVVAGGPLVTNGGFEAPVGAEITGWQTSVGTSTGVAVVTAPVHDGRQSLRMAVTAGDPLEVVNARFDVTAGTNLNLEAWAYATNARPARIALRFSDRAGQVLATAERTVSPKPRTWTRADLVALVPDGSQTAQVVLSAPPTQTSEMFWDDVSVRPVTWRETDLGTPVEGVTITRAAFGVSDGRDLIYASCAGNPGLFEAIDVQTGAVVAAIELPDTKGAWGIAAAPDGSVYIGTYSQGLLYRWIPTTQQLTKVGRATPSSAYIFDIEFDDQGILWGASYPKAEVFSFDPATGVFHNYGSMVNDEEYAHTLAVTGGKIYVGLATNHPRIAVLDPATGGVSIIELPAEWRSPGYVFDLDARGDHLLARVRLNSASHLITYHLPSNTWQDVEPVGVFAVSPTDETGHAYYVGIDGTLKSFDVRSGSVASTGFTGLSASRGLGWVHGTDPEQGPTKLATFDGLGFLGVYDPATGTGEVRETQTKGTPAQLQAIATGPDGKIYVGGYQFSGLSSFDPATDQVERFIGGVQQVEGLHTHGTELYIGDYGGAGVYRYDPKRPWVERDNPFQFAKLASSGQDRPFAWASAGNLVAFGTVPGYGLLGGALGVYDPVRNEVGVHTGVVRDQSVVALAATSTTIYGGTSVYGGGGSTPTEHTGRVFAWDIRTATKIWETSPFPGAKAVTALALAPNGNLWGSTVGTLFEMDRNGQVLRSVQLATFPWGQSRWVSDHVSFGPDGYLYVITAPSSAATLWQVDPVTLTSIKIATGITYWSIAHHGGDLYFKRLSTLCRLRRS